MNDQYYAFEYTTGRGTLTADGVRRVAGQLYAFPTAGTRDIWCTWSMETRKGICADALPLGWRLDDAVPVDIYELAEWKNLRSSR